VHPSRQIARGDLDVGVRSDDRLFRIAQIPRELNG
jgi:hypothetical protein